LERENQNIIVTSESRARVASERHARIRARAIELLDACQANKGNGQPGAAPAPIVEEPVSAQGAAPAKNGASAQEPLPTKPSSWWRPFVFGGGLIPKGDVILALRMILGELRIPIDERALDFGTEQVAKSTFCQVLEKLTGGDLGWRTMGQIYERAQARERLWADH
jgi:hypothetical protein